jgi:hypothetical protein
LKIDSTQFQTKSFKFLQIFHTYISGLLQAGGEVNVVEVQQDPDQSSEDLASDFASEGKPRSITYFLLTPATFPFM